MQTSLDIACPDRHRSGAEVSPFPETETHSAKADAAAAQFHAMRGYLASDDALAGEHGDIESYLWTQGMELLRLLYQDHFDLRSLREPRRQDVTDVKGQRHASLESGHRRDLESRFGTIVVSRLAYRHPGTDNLYPADAAANLPAERYSHGLRELAAIEAARGSFAEAKEAIDRASAAKVAKRQVEQLAQGASVDFDAFLSARSAPMAGEEQVVVISADGKGIVMRPEGLRDATAAKAAGSENKLDGRLSPGEKANHKRMAEVGAVYTVTPIPRTPRDVMAQRGDGPPKDAPKATDKWLTASVVEDTASVIATIFDEAERRDPDHSHVWVGLVDGNKHQIDRFETEAAARKIDLHNFVDWIHVLEYIWSSAWSFFDHGDPGAEKWLAEKALEVLSGRAVIVPAAIRRKATTLGLDDTTRKNADKAADYLLAKAPTSTTPQPWLQGGRSRQE